MSILITLAVMLAIALIAGVLLSVFSHFFAVEDNLLKKKIRKCLPSINCGACGFKSCNDYATALSEGRAKPNLCIPGAQNAADKIAKLLGIEPEPLEDVVAFVACNGHCDATHPKAQYEGVQTCHAASMIYGGSNSCRFGCIGYGDCAKVCPSNAICMKDGIAHIQTDKCLGCTICTRTCPKHIIVMLPQKTSTVVMCSNTQKGADARKVCKNACITCKKCERLCPNGAISFKNNLAVIDYKKCVNCGICIKECPTGCLKSVFFPDIPENVSVKELIS